MLSGSSRIFGPTPVNQNQTNPVQQVHTQGRIIHSEFYPLFSGHLQIVLAQTDREKAIIRLLEKLG